MMKTVDMVVAVSRLEEGGEAWVGVWVGVWCVPPPQGLILSLGSAAAITINRSQISIAPSSEPGWLITRH